MKCVLALAAVLGLFSTAYSFPSLPPPPGVPERLKEHLRRLDSEVEEERVKAVRGIQDLGPWGRPAVPALSAAIPEGSPRLVSAIAETLIPLGPTARQAIPALMEIVRRPKTDGWLLTVTARAVAALGEPANPEMIRACLAAYSEGRKSASPAYTLMSLHAEVVPVVAGHLQDAELPIRYNAALSLYRYFERWRANNATEKSLAPEVQSAIAARLRMALEDPSANVRAWSLSALINLDPSAVRSSLPVFITLIRRNENYWPGQEAILRAGPAGMRALIDYLDEPDAAVRTILVNTLTRFGEDAAPVLIAGTRHPNPAVRASVIVACSARVSDRQNERVRRAVANRLADEDERVRLAAAKALVAINPAKAAAAIPVLTEAAFKSDADGRERALDSLENMGVHARPAVPAMLRRASSGDLMTRFGAARVLASADRSTWKTYVPLFIQVVRSDEVRRGYAARLLRDTGPDARAALPDLRQMLEDEEPINRIRAAEAIARIAPNDAADAIKCLTQLLDTEAKPRTGIHKVAIRTLQELGPLAKDAIPRLLDVMRSEQRQHFAVAAAIAIFAIDPAQSREAYDRFRAELNPANPDPDETWLEIMPNLGKAALPLLPEMIRALKSKQDVQLTNVLETLAALGPAASPALPELRELDKAGRYKRQVQETIQAITAKK